MVDGSSDSSLVASPSLPLDYGPGGITAPAASQKGWLLIDLLVRAGWTAGCLCSRGVVFMVRFQSLGVLRPFKVPY